MHQKALSAPGHWAAVSEAMLREEQNGLPYETAIAHLEEAAKACEQAFRVVQPSVYVAWSAGLASRGMAAPRGTDGGTDCRQLVWLLRHLKQFASDFPALRPSTHAQPEAVSSAPNSQLMQTSWRVR